MSAPTCPTCAGSGVHPSGAGYCAVCVGSGYLPAGQASLIGDQAAQLDLFGAEDYRPPRRLGDAA